MILVGMARGAWDVKRYQTDMHCISYMKTRLILIGYIFTSLIDRKANKTDVKANIY